MGRKQSTKSALESLSTSGASRVAKSAPKPNFRSTASSRCGLNRLCRFEPAASLHVEDFFHLRPPFAFCAGLQGLLHGHHDGPPLLSFGIGRHLLYVSFVVRPVIFVVAEQVAVFKIDRVIADVAVVYPFQDFRPDSAVIGFIALHRLGPESDYQTVSFHRLNFGTLL